MKNTISHKISVVFAPLLLLILLVSAPDNRAYAQGAGDMVVSPTRIVFEGRDRTAQVTIANRGTATSVFRISFLEMAMAESGQLVHLEEGVEPPTSAKSLIRYAPRQVKVEPGATQVIRLSLRKPADLADGEYRSHMFFRAVPPESAGRDVADDAELEDGQLNITLIPIYGITIPVIVHHGELSTTAEIKSVSLVQETESMPMHLDMMLGRNGSKSPFGDITATYYPAGGGEPTVVGQVNRLAVYMDVTERRVLVPLTLPDGLTLGAGRIDVSYRETGDGSAAELAAGSVALP